MTHMKENFSCMNPTIIISDKHISELTTIGRQKKMTRFFFICKVVRKNAQLELHCTEIAANDSEGIQLAADQIVIYSTFVPEIYYMNPNTSEYEDFKQQFYEMMTENTRSYNAYNIYSIISEMALIKNQLNIRFCMFVPQPTIEITELKKSDEISSLKPVNGPTYKIRKSQPTDDPNTVYAYFLGVDGITDSRVYSLAYSIYLSHQKNIEARLNDRLYKIIAHDGSTDIEIVTKSFTLSKKTPIEFQFELEKKKACVETFTQDTLAEKHDSKSISLSTEVLEYIGSLQQQIKDLRSFVEEKDRMYQEKLESQNEEMKTLLNSILFEVQKKAEKPAVKPFRQIWRNPITSLEMSAPSVFENKIKEYEYADQKPINTFDNVQPNEQQKIASNPPPAYPAPTIKMNDQQSSSISRQKVNYDKRVSQEQKRMLSKENYNYNGSNPSISSSKQRYSQLASIQNSNGPMIDNKYETTNSIKSKFSQASNPFASDSIEISNKYTKPTIRFSEQLLEIPDSLRDSPVKRSNDIYDDSSSSIRIPDVSIDTRQFLKTIGLNE